MQTNRQFFCINQGRPLGARETFNVRSEIRVSNGVVNTDANFSRLNTEIRGLFSGDRTHHEISYIVYRANRTIAGGTTRRASMDDCVYSNAIWEILPDQEAEKHAAAAQALARRARIYADFALNGARNPNDPVVILYRGVDVTPQTTISIRPDGLIGPFIIEHTMVGTEPNIFGYIMDEIGLVRCNTS